MYVILKIFKVEFIINDLKLIRIIVLILFDIRMDIFEVFVFLLDFEFLVELCSVRINVIFMEVFMIICIIVIF